jgi:hypothetical protein
MANKFFRTWLFVLSCFAATLYPSHLFAQTAYGVTTTGQLVRFDVTSPGVISSNVTITGLVAGDTIAGIDFRPATGQLYGLGSQSRLYVINTTTGAATQVGVDGAFALNGLAFGFDFNPSVDRIRVVSDTEQNLRLNPDTGALTSTDTPLAYSAGDPNVGVNPAVAGSAYTNNVAGASVTTLYGIDTTQDVLVIQNPPNTGGLTTVGALGVNASAVLGFDIVTAGGVDVAYAAMQVGVGVPSGLYRINLATGAATLVGNFPGVMSIRGLAIDPNPPRLAALSTRLDVLTGQDVAVGGFIIGGSTPKTVVVRARGPSLAAQGVPGPLANPQLQLFSGATEIFYNDDWEDAANAAQILASGFAPSDPNESAIMTTLAPGAYTAIVSGLAGTTGIGIVEVFEVDALSMPLIGISTRGKVLTGAQAMIGGFIIQGTAPRTVIVRARGPSLAAAGLLNVLQNPQLQLFSGSTEIAYNNNWQDSDQAAIQASGFAPSDPNESAIRITLAPGAYTAIVTGVAGTTGLGIVEVYLSP